MHLYFLGTGAGMPSRQRNVSSIILNLLDECGSCWMFDCGEGTQQQVLQAPVKLSKMNKLFVTHLHGDHLFGIPGLLTSRSNQGGEEKFTVYGPTGIRAYVETSLNISESRLNYELQVVEIGEGIIYEDEQFKVEAALLDHRVASYGFRIVEKDQPGSLDAVRLRQLGVTPGPVYGMLKQGKTITLEDGSVLDGKEFIGPTIPGRIVVILGDTRYCHSAVNLSQNADVIVHEATFAKEQAELAEQFYHSTAEQASLVASKANAGTLILTHISARYQDEQCGQLLVEAREHFSNTWLASDFWSFELKKGAFPTGQ